MARTPHINRWGVNVGSGGYSTLNKTPRFGAEQRIKLPGVPKRPVRFQIRTLIRHKLLRKEPYWFTLHKRGPVRPKQGIDPLEQRAVPKSLIAGTLPERILWQALVADLHMIPYIDFIFQSCVECHHKVLTADLRWVDAGDLQVGDKLISFDEEPVDNKARRYKIGTVVHNFIDTVDGYKVELSDGTKITTTAEHPWIVQGDRRYDYLVKGASQMWARTDELKPGIVVPRFFRTWKEDTSKDAGYIAGFFDGEGSIVVSKSQTGGNVMNVSITQNNGFTLDSIKDALKRRGFPFDEYNYSDKYERSYDAGHRKASQLRLSGGRAEYLRFLGMIRPAKLSKFNPDRLGRLVAIDLPAVVSVKPVGKIEIARLEVDTHTYFVEGFGMHNSQQGGRLSLGGLVADFLFPIFMMVVQVDGPTHVQNIQMRKDMEEDLALNEMGYQVYHLPQDIVYNEYEFDDWLEKTFGWTHSGGADSANDYGEVIQSNGFTTDKLYQSVRQLQDTLDGYTR